MDYFIKVSNEILYEFKVLNIAYHVICVEKLNFISNNKHAKMQNSSAKSPNLEHSETDVHTYSIPPSHSWDSNPRIRIMIIIQVDAYAQAPEWEQAGARIFEYVPCKREFNWPVDPARCEMSRSCAYVGNRAIKIVCQDSMET